VRAAAVVAGAVVVTAAVWFVLSWVLHAGDYFGEGQS
jgi:hypothetical protein